MPQRPIDRFLRSLAKDKRNRAIGVILSGTGSDGRVGLQAIKTEGGINFAQDEKSATHHDMPRNAIRTGCLDFELTPVRIAEELARLARDPDVMTVVAARHKESLPSLSNDLAQGDSFHQISHLLSRATGVDFSHYKPKAIQRCINRRMAQRHLDGMDAYAAYLREHDEEVDSLYQDLFIGPSRFFRDPETFEILKKRVFPEILKWHVGNGPLRVWLLGCSTGELAYSVAIAFREFSKSKARQIPVQILATDSNVKAIERARIGSYSQSIVNDVSPERLRCFFTKNDEGYQVNKPIRNMCIFARQNLLADPPFSRINLIVFHNRLTYLAPASQKKVMLALHYSLTPRGLLLLDSRPMTQQFKNLLRLKDTKCKIYSKIPGSFPHAYSLQRGEAPRQQLHAVNQPPMYRLRSKRSVAQLRQQLEFMHAQLQSVIGQSAADMQEQETAHEELQASNEELQSLNEELENTRPELETTNEALERSNQEALQLNDHLGNLLSSVQLPIIMVDHDLRIQRFTPAAKRLLNIIDPDVGRPFTDLNLRVDLPRLPGLLREVMHTFRFIEEEVQDREGRWYSLQIRPYKTLQNRIEGAVLTMVDIDQLKRDREKLRAYWSSCPLSRSSFGISIQASSRRIRAANSFTALPVRKLSGTSSTICSIQFTLCRSKRSRRNSTCEANGKVNCGTQPKMAAK